MRAVITALAIAVLLAGCAEEGTREPASRGPVTSAGLVDNPSLSVAGPSREGADRACRAEAGRFDAALSPGRDADAIVASFDALALCRTTAARQLVAGHGQGQVPRAEAGAALIGLRGAMRRDVGRIRTALLNRQDVEVLNSRIARAQDLQNVLIVNGS